MWYTDIRMKSKERLLSDGILHQNMHAPLDSILCCIFFNIKVTKYPSSMNYIVNLCSGWNHANGLGSLFVRDQSFTYFFSTMTMTYIIHTIQISQTSSTSKTFIFEFSMFVSVKMFDAVFVMGLYIILGNAFQQSNLSQRITLLYYLQTYDLKV